MNLIDLQMQSRPESEMKRGRPFPPGNCASPYGRGATARKIEAQAAEFTTAFERVHSRPADAGERVMIQHAAVLSIQLRRSLSADEAAKLANSCLRLLKRLGLSTPEPQKLSERERREKAIDRILKVNRG